MLSKLMIKYHESHDHISHDSDVIFVVIHLHINWIACSRKLTDIK